MLIGFWIAGLVAEKYTLADGHAWRSIWVVPAAIAGAVFLIFALFFKDKRSLKTSTVITDRKLAGVPVS